MTTIAKRIWNFLKTFDGVESLIIKDASWTPHPCGYCNAENEKLSDYIY